MEFTFKHQHKLLFVLIIILGSFLRFYNLNWGAPFYFHPDERNIAGSISRMYWEKTLNPHFFAYGGFWSYPVLFLIKLTNITNFPYSPVFPQDPFSRAIIILRFFSALQGIGLIILSYFVAKIFIKKGVSLLLPFLIATSPGLIQASHFGTFESSLTFLYFLMFYLCLKYWQTKKSRWYFAAVVVFGTGVAIKVTSIVLLPILFFLAVFISRRKNKLAQILKIFTLFLLLIIIPALIFYLSNPFAFDFSKFQISNPKSWNLFSSDFLGTMKYEAAVAQGTMLVFYAQQFQKTIPILYQFVKVLPFALNPVVFILFLISLLFLISQISLFFFRETRHGASLQNKKNIISAFIRYKSAKIQAINFPALLNLLFLGTTFLPNSILYVKWTRYIIPSLPYIYIFVFLFLLKLPQLPLFSPTLLISLISLIFSIFFTSIYSSDTRIEAANWARTNLPSNSKIISEVYDMGIVTFNEVFHYSQIRLFNFYDLDDKVNDEVEMQELKNLISEATVIVLPSSRIASSRFLNNNSLSSLYPNGNWFYSNLFNGSFGFRLAKTFSHPYDKIIPGLTPDESFTVFDHPSVMIFVKESSS